jgi:hypothetical protein
MNITVIISIAIFVATLVGLFNYGRVNSTLDSQLMRFGKAGTYMKYVLLALGAVLFVASLYSLYMWIRLGTVVSIQQSLSDLGQDLVAEADRVGDEIRKYEGDLAGGPSDEAVGKAANNLGNQSSKLVTVMNGRQPGFVGSSGMDNLLERYHTPRFDPQIGSNCSRTYKNAGNCQGVSRLFRDDAQMVNSCRKLTVVAPQSFPNTEAVRFTL